MVFLNMIVKNIYNKAADFQNSNISIFVPITPVITNDDVFTSYYNVDNYRIPVPADMHTLIGLSYSNKDRIQVVRNTNIELIGDFYYFNYVSYTGSLFLEYIPTYTNITDLETNLPRYLVDNIPYITYMLAIYLARSAGDGDTVADLREEMKSENIYLRGSDRPVYI